MPNRNRFSEMFDEVAAWRRDLHENPELLFDTHRTAEIVSRKLHEFGCDRVVTGIGRTGVVGVIRGRSNSSNRTIGLRADMDALPIKETTGLEYASRVDGVMHACGHDGHTAMLLGAAKYLSESRNFDGVAVVIFQPAEEGGGGGKEMVDDGLMSRFGIQEVYGMHNMPGMAVNEFAIRSGPFFASADSFEIRVEGEGGHAAMPHDTIDPTIVSCHIGMALQTIAARNADPVKSIVVSLTSIVTSTTTHNVIPGFVELKGTVRALEQDSRELAARRIRRIAESTAIAYGARALVDYQFGYPVMANSEVETRYAVEAARRVSGRVNDEAAPLMGAEDFAFMLESRPGAYILVGNGDSAPVHNSGYDFNDEAILAGCSWWVEIAEHRMPLS